MHSFRAAIVVVLFCAFTLGSADAASPTGTWLTQKGDAHIRISHCGKALCGTVVWLKDAIDPATGKPPVDGRNPDPRKRGRKIFGLRIFAMAPNGQGTWAGSIYNSDDGQTYAGKLLWHGAGRLEVQGCAGVICGGEMWRRVGR
ncbi:MAG: DUF2147 domain-containing protein [Pseudolabrys sp.]